MAQKRVNSSPNTNKGKRYKSFYQEVNLQLEYHLPGYSFCGPGTNLNKRLDEADNLKAWSKPINRVDEVCMKHDIDYGNSTTLEDKHEADRDMLYNLSLIQNPTLREKDTDI